MPALTRTILAAAFLIASLSCSLRAQTNIWIGPATGDWFDGSNWSLGVVPSMFEDVRIDDAVAQDTTVNYGSLNQQRIGEAFSLAIDQGDTFNMAAESDLHVGSVSNVGTMTIAGLSGTGPLGLRFGSLLQNHAGGVVDLHQGSISANLRFGRNNAGLLWNQGTIQGSGGIDENFDGISIKNNGLIDANRAGETLAIHDPFNGFANPTGGTHRNGGTMQASSEGTLGLNNFSDSPLLNTDAGVVGTIQALGDSTVEIRNSRIVGGRITTSSAGGVEEGTIRLIESASLAGVESDAKIIVGSSDDGSALLTLYDSSIANQGTITVGERDILSIQGTVALSGGGQVELDSVSRIISSNSSNNTPNRLLNVDNTIRKIGQGGANIGGGMIVDNQGTIESFGFGSPLVLNLTPRPEHANGAPAWNNTGTIRALAGGAIIIGSSGDNQLNNVGGVIEAQQDGGINFSDATIIGGTIRGAGTNASFDGVPLLRDVRFEGNVETDNGSFLLQGAIDNVGTLGGDLGFVGEVTLGGGGVVQAAGFESAGLSGGADHLINSDNTFVLTNNGASFNNLRFTNRGMMETVGQSAFGQISANNDGNEFTNSGVIRAIGGSNLQISETVINYEFDTLGDIVAGKIQAGTGSFVEVERVLGGTLQTAGDGILRVNDDLNYDDSGQTPRFSEAEVKILGAVEFQGFSIAGIIRNEGLLTSDSSVGLRGGIVQLLGNGRFVLNTSLGIAPGQTLVNGPEHTIQGSVVLTGSTLINQGRIESAEGQSAEVRATQIDIAHHFMQQGELISRANSQFSISDVRNLTNKGLIRSETGSTMMIRTATAVMNQGTIDVQASSTMFFEGTANPAVESNLVNTAGSLLQGDGQLQFTNSNLVNEAGGRVEGGGVLAFQGQGAGFGVVSHGTVAPSGGNLTSEIGQLEIFGDYTQSTTGVLEIQIGGTSFEEFDKLGIPSGGDILLDGTLEVSLIDLGLGQGLFEPELGDSFEFIQYSSGASGGLSGQFDSLDLPELSAGLDWQIEYLPQVVSLNVIAAGVLPADFNTDGTVDDWDLMEWQTAYGTSDAADANGDQSSDGLDYLAWQQQFTGGAATSAAAIPEPNTAMLLACVFAAAVGTKFRQRG